MTKALTVEKKKEKKTYLVTVPTIGAFRVVRNGFWAFEFME